MTRPRIACLGAGRMGRGIAVAYAYAGHRVTLVDLKARPGAGFADLAASARAEINAALDSLAAFGLMPREAAAAIAARVDVAPFEAAPEALPGAAIVFEGVPEIVAVKRALLAGASALMAPEAILASTTSTILVDALADAVVRPERFLNAHWLNPAYLVPLVELSPGARTDPAVTAALTASLEGIGKVPVACAARPGYIVPRIQALAMNEAARMVEEGVASAEDIDKAVRYGFGFRFAVLGLTEFIDWGGGDILHYASRYLAESLGDPRYAAPPIIARNMEAGRIGLRTGKGFLDYEGRDVVAYQRERLAAFAGLLAHFGLARPPVLGEEP
ncbi:3-hydroxybutyryl-CoA dehydrogenase [Methylobacterium crusticola]|uniref:L-gulonate 3-dehydrogenase n=1 Tax=Methylobacterium crusticola TaxID=1697972 RepID=A0ABQ4R398_9HYPH|nr:3-hydroxybutyryl-CoA dehydrogenase [Methylobacterium crusticola]GJD51430.1 3-hydroxybutyryl-CoA dehydrogenase [Methylobacterium crusticola]